MPTSHQDQVLAFMQNPTQIIAWHSTAHHPPITHPPSVDQMNVMDDESPSPKFPHPGYGAAVRR